MDDFMVRLAGAPDRAAVEACTRNAYAAFARRVGYDPEPLTADYGALIAAGQVRVLEQEGTTAAVLVVREETDHLLIYSVAVAPDHQGRGLGRALMAETETIARRLGRDRIVLYTNEKMAENVRFYESLGYRTFARRANKSRPGNWIIYMHKSLAQAG
jgi:ribosomal protein S18 acetylase RimI-like enzyme